MSSKNNKNQNTTETPADRLARLQREMEATKNELAEAGKVRIDAIAAQIDGLPKMFGVDSLDAVSNLIRQRSKGTLGSLVVANRQRTEVDEPTKLAAIESIRSGKEQRSQVATRLNVHPQTIFNWLKDAGLTNSRTTPAPVVAPANVAA